MKKCSNKIKIGFAFVFCFLLVVFIFSSMLNSHTIENTLGGLKLGEEFKGAERNAYFMEKIIPTSKFVEKVAKENSDFDVEMGRDDFVYLKSIVSYEIKKNDNADMNSDIDSLFDISNKVKIGVDLKNRINYISFDIDHETKFYQLINNSIKNEKALMVDYAKIKEEKEKSENGKILYDYMVKYQYQNNTNINVYLEFSSFLDPENLKGKSISKDNIETLSITFTKGE